MFKEQAGVHYSGHGRGSYAFERLSTEHMIVQGQCGAASSTTRGSIGISDLEATLCWVSKLFHDCGAMQDNTINSPRTRNLNEEPHRFRIVGNGRCCGQRIAANSQGEWLQ